MGEKEPVKERANKELKEKIINDESLAYVKSKALEIVKTGFNAGDGYGEVWIRDYNTFIELSGEVYDKQIIKENLLVFLRMQGKDGNIIDGFIPREKAVQSTIGYEYIYNLMEPRYAGHKNTVETDQESSLVQAVYKYLSISGDKGFLSEIIGDNTVTQRLESSLEFLMNYLFNEKYGLIWGATTADWGDIQPEHDWGVFLTDDTHYAIDIYDNAMFLIALDNFMEMVPEKREIWQKIRDTLRTNCKKYLWDADNQKFIPHIYLNGSPFPYDLNENEIHYHGGMVMEAYEQLQPMIKRVKDNNGFYEWYIIDNKPRGSGTFRGEAGVLYKAIIMLEPWVGNRKTWLFH